jgi:hypothetical protein
MANGNGGLTKRRMENLLGAEEDQFLPIRVRPGLMAIWSARSFKRIFGDLNFAKLFSEIPEAHTRGKTSIFHARTMDLSLGR